jgi:hypothetical protein
MKCSFELPVRHINQLKEHQDYDFTLAHLVLQSEEYRAAYGAGNVMDNGYYELGEPLELRELSRAVKLGRPRVVISPDWHDNPTMTLRAYRDAVAFLDCEVAGVVVGTTIEDMLMCYREYAKQGTDIICLPFRLERLGLLKYLAEHNELDKEKWYHFLGLRSMKELNDIKAYGLKYSSIDTSKPIKAAIHRKNITDDLRGLGRLDMNAQLDNETLERCRFNMDRFREEAQK